MVLQALDDITFSNPVNLTTAAAGLTAQAGRSILVNSTITTTNGAISLRAVDPASGAADTAGELSIGAALNSGTAPAPSGLPAPPASSWEPASPQASLH